MNAENEREVHPARVYTTPAGEKTKFDEARTRLL